MPNAFEGVNGGVSFPSNGGPPVFELGITGSTPGIEVGVTETFGKEIFRSSIVGDTVRELNDIFTGVKDFFSGSNPPSASGGFVIYPSKPNTNLMQQVYSK